MDEQKSPTPGGNQGKGETQKQHSHPNSSEQQRQRLSHHLHMHGSITTCEARRELDILCPAARVMELRRSGLEIDLIWVDDVSEVGKLHRVGKYLLAMQERP